jgi:hypothetical protein
LIISLFLQKLYTYYWNPIRASQKLSAAVPKLCAVPKLGDLTVFICCLNWNNMKAFWSLMAFINQPKDIRGWLFVIIRNWSESVFQIRIRVL